MAKSQNGWKKLSGSGRRRIEKILARGDRAFYRQFNSARRRHMKGVAYAA